MSVKQIRHCLYCSAVAIYYFTGKLSRKGILPRRDHYASTGNQQYFWTTPWAHYLFLYCGKTRARVSQFVFVVAIAAVAGMETAQDPAGTSEPVHALELWQFTPEKSMIQWVKKKNIEHILKWVLLWAWVSLCNFIRVNDNWSKQYEDAEHAHSPALSVQTHSNCRTCRDHGAIGFCWSEKNPFLWEQPH